MHQLSLNWHESEVSSCLALVLQNNVHVAQLRPSRLRAFAQLAQQAQFTKQAQQAQPEQAQQQGPRQEAQEVVRAVRWAIQSTSPDLLALW